MFEMKKIVTLLLFGTIVLPGNLNAMDSSEVIRENQESNVDAFDQAELLIIESVRRRDPLEMYKPSPLLQYPGLGLYCRYPYLDLRQYENCLTYIKLLKEKGLNTKGLDKELLSLLKWALDENVERYEDPLIEPEDVEASLENNERDRIEFKAKLEMLLRQNA